jgi:hypothetical protein
MNLQGRLKALEEGTPDGYRTLDTAGNIVINSPLPAFAWFKESMRLLKEGSAAARAALRSQLESSVCSSGKDHLFEVVRAFAAGPVDREGESR